MAEAGSMLKSWSTESRSSVALRKVGILSLSVAGCLDLVQKGGTRDRWSEEGVRVGVGAERIKRPPRPTEVDPHGMGREMEAGGAARQRAGRPSP